VKHSSWEHLRVQAEELTRPLEENEQVVRGRTQNMLYIFERAEKKYYEPDRG